MSFWPFEAFFSQDAGISIPPSPFPHRPMVFPGRPGMFRDGPVVFPKRSAVFRESPGVFPRRPVAFPDAPAVFPTRPRVFPRPPTMFPADPAAFPDRASRLPHGPTGFPVRLRFTRLLEQETRAVRAGGRQQDTPGWLVNFGRSVNFTAAAWKIFKIFCGVPVPTG